MNNFAIAIQLSNRIHKQNKLLEFFFHFLVVCTQRNVRRALYPNAKPNHNLLEE
jgi:hypothetical protein